ncbi:hypothetical protein HYH03_008220 [Edaphochlamys debaryana]|uniref:Plastid ribosomal protein S21 n=1 Tax=Edaphochlamys debaryana TaxID=47281 RepID=A0A836BYD7_9CHLO|nr:hypothetical protein HYH03_008220 [Edaphochlamys debaryana]|eukprot:KAG2493706.1 hypothetical protein HYH03_008220 [Edaphochlamys debaryana]
MQTTLLQRQALAGKAFGSVRPTVAPRSAVVAQARKKDSYMVEVEVGEDEPEDVAVRRYMKLVMQSRVVEKLRARKVKETKIEEYKRRFRERVEMRKAGIVEPSFAELYPTEVVAGPFEDFYQARDEEDPDGAYDGLASGADDIFNAFGTAAGAYDAGSYGTTRWTGNYAAGGNSSFGNTGTWQGGYMP